MLYNLHFFSLQNAVYFIMLPCLVSITHILNTGCAKIWRKKKSVAKRLKKKKQRSLSNRTSFHIALGVFPKHFCNFSCPVQVSKAELQTGVPYSTRADAVSTTHTHGYNRLPAKPLNAQRVPHATVAPEQASKHITSTHTAVWCAPHRTIFTTNGDQCPGTGSPS